MKSIFIAAALAALSAGSALAQDAAQGGPRLIATIAAGQMQLHAVLRPRWVEKVLGFAEN